MNVAEDLDRRVYLKHHRLCFEHLLGFFCQGHNVFTSEREVRLTINLG